MRDSKDYKLLDNIAVADVQGKVAHVDDFRNAVLNVSTGNSGSMTIKIAGSIQDTPPDITAAQSPTNAYDFVQVIDLNSGASVNGDTGIVLNGAANESRNLEVNINGMRWLTAIVDSYTAGNADVTIRLFNNQ